MDRLHDRGASRFMRTKHFNNKQWVLFVHRGDIALIFKRLLISPKVRKVRKSERCCNWRFDKNNLS